MMNPNDMREILRIDPDTFNLSSFEIDRVLQSYAGLPDTRDTWNRISEHLQRLDNEMRVRGLDGPVARMQGDPLMNKLRIIEGLVRSDVAEINFTSDPRMLEQSYLHAPPTGVMTQRVGIFIDTRNDGMRSTLGLEPIVELIPTGERHEAVLRAMQSFVDTLTDIAAAGGVIQADYYAHEDSHRPAPDKSEPTKRKSNEIEIDLD